MGVVAGGGLHSLSLTPSPPPPLSGLGFPQGVEWSPEEDRLLVEQLTLMRGGAFSTKNMTVRAIPLIVISII